MQTKKKKKSKTYNHSSGLAHTLPIHIHSHKLTQTREGVYYDICRQIHDAQYYLTTASIASIFISSFMSVWGCSDEGAIERGESREGEQEGDSEGGV